VAVHFGTPKKASRENIVLIAKSRTSFAAGEEKLHNNIKKDLLQPANNIIIYVLQQFEHQINARLSLSHSLTLSFYCK